MSHSPDPQTLLALELCCRSLAQRILLIRELQALVLPIDVSTIRHEHEPLDQSALPIYLPEIQRHIRELSELEERFHAACDEHARLHHVLTFPLPSPNQQGTSQRTLRELITAEL